MRSCSTAPMRKPSAATSPSRCRARARSCAAIFAIVVVLPQPGGPMNTSTRRVLALAGRESANRRCERRQTLAATHRAVPTRESIRRLRPRSRASRPVAARRAASSATGFCGADSAGGCRFADSSGRAPDIFALDARRSLRLRARPSRPRQPPAGTSSVESTRASGPSSSRTARSASRTVGPRYRFKCMSVQRGDGDDLQSAAAPRCATARRGAAAPARTAATDAAAASVSTGAQAVPRPCSSTSAIREAMRCACCGSSASTAPCSVRTIDDSSFSSSAGATADRRQLALARSGTAGRSRGRSPRAPLR